MRTPHDAVLQTKYNKLISIIEEYHLLDLWEDMVADLDGLDLDISQLCNLAEALLSKNLVLTTEFHLKDRRWKKQYNLMRNVDSVSTMKF